MVLPPDKSGIPFITQMEARSEELEIQPTALTAQRAGRSEAQLIATELPNNRFERDASR